MAEGYLLISLFASLLGQQDTVNVGKHTTSSNGDTTKQLAQLLVVAHGQLNVTGHNASLLVVASCIACQLKDLSCKVLQDCGLQQSDQRISKSWKLCNSLVCALPTM